MPFMWYQCFYDAAATAAIAACWSCGMLQETSTMWKPRTMDCVFLKMTGKEAPGLVVRVSAVVRGEAANAEHLITDALPWPDLGH